MAIKLDRVSFEDFKQLDLEIRGLPRYFTVLPNGQILIWPALDTAQVVITCDIT